MKAIKKTDRKFSFKLKIVIFFAAILAILAFYFSVKFSGNSKKDFPELHFSEKISIPVCSSPGGFFKDIITVKLECSDPGTLIYYTTDGSEPSLASLLYDQPIIIENKTGNRNYLSAIPTSPRWMPPISNVFKGTVLRAIAVDEQNRKSKELVRSIFVDPAKKHTLPVISITINQKDFFGYNKGIYVLGKSYTDKDNYIRKSLPLDLPWWEYPSNYLLRGPDTERPANIEFYEPSGQLGFESAVGIRIHGNATRGYAQKSLRISFRAEYGLPVLNYDLFGRNKNQFFHSFILRNSGNDWDKTMFRDAFMQSLMKNSFIDIQDYRPSIVFINGEYWGIHNIRERFDENYLANKYHFSADSVTILELSGKRVRGEKDDEEMFASLLDFVKTNDLSVKENYDYVKSKMDIESFQDFIIANVFFCNSDWPNNNVRFWRYNGVAGNDSLLAKDGKWRWMLYDTDWGFGYNSMSTPDVNLLEKASKIGSSGILFNSLQQNKNFRNQFTTRFQHLLNSVFSTPELLSRIDQMQATLAPEMQEHIERWRSIGSYRQWLNNVDVLRDFARKRPMLQASQLNVFFKLKEQDQITIKK